MKTILIIILLFAITWIDLAAQCEPIMMNGSGAEFTEQVCYVEETDFGFSVYIRRHYFMSNLDDPRNGVYIQERDTCLQLIKESLFLRTIDIQNRLFQPKDRIFIFKSKTPGYLWILSGGSAIKYNTTNKTYSIFNVETPFQWEDQNFIELDNGNFVAMGQWSGLYLLDSNFQNIAIYRSFWYPFNKIENQSLFYHLEPTPVPLFETDSAIVYSDFNGTLQWKYTYPIEKMPFFYHGDFSDAYHFLVGGADPDGNNVAYNPIIYKFDKSGQLISSVFLQTNVFRAASARHCLYANSHLYVLGSQTISRRPKEVWQSFVAKLDTNLNLIWKKDLELDCGPLSIQFRRPLPTRDGGILINIASVNPNDDSCQPVLIKLNGDGRIATSEENIKKLELSIFPNPVKDVISLGQEIAIEIKSINLTDLNGIHSGIKLLGSDCDLSDLNPGVYLLRVELKSGKVLYQKIIKI